ncbi:hypothetical protein NUW58_g3251 [Xylaria curta]|uniref:Uncharacterized protein n=1 Tax=Xylaria curta TaxID=42375 RepID=A0ACC1PBV6_9PEZI|nr:hypothetical protein NUW58_g3251 [Xylaria curta]
MVTFNIAYTAPINKTGATPILTQPQVWEGLKMKVRKAQDFVSAITECQVLSEETLPSGELQITRQVRFAPSTAHSTGGSVKEVCASQDIAFVRPFISRLQQRPIAQRASCQSTPLSLA